LSNYKVGGSDGVSLEIDKWKRGVESLTDAGLRRETVEHNFRIGRQHYSLAALRGYLTRLMGHP